MKTLTIVTITFEDPTGLKKTRDSLPQSGFEWIVVDGTKSQEIANKNKDILTGREVFLIQEPDKGRFDAMNKGLYRAKGDVICFLNSGDEFVSKDIVSKVLDSCELYDWKWAVGETKAIDYGGNLLWSWPMPTHNSLKLKLGINSYCHQATFVKKSLLVDIGGFDVNSFYSDWIVSLILSKESRPANLKFLTTLFLVGGVSGQQSIKYWKDESCRLRKKFNNEILHSSTIDRTMQNLAAKFISSTRGQLIRPDLVRAYP